MIVALALILMIAFFSLPANIIRKFYIKYPLERKKALLFSLMITACFGALLLLEVVISVAVEGDKSPAFMLLSEGIGVILVLGCLIFLWNYAVLVKGSGQDAAYKELALRYNDFFTPDLSEQIKEQPKGSLKKLYANASKEGLSTVDYIEKHIPQKVLMECEKLSQNGEELYLFLRLCEEHKVIRHTYNSVLYYKYLGLDNNSKR